MIYLYKLMQLTKGGWVDVERYRKIKAMPTVEPTEDEIEAIRQGSVYIMEHSKDEGPDMDAKR